MTAEQNRRRQLLAAFNAAAAAWCEFCDNFNHAEGDIIESRREKWHFNKMKRKAAAVSEHIRQNHPTNAEAIENAGAAAGAFTHPAGHLDFDEARRWIINADRLCSHK